MVDEVCWDLDNGSSVIAKIGRAVSSPGAASRYLWSRIRPIVVPVSARVLSWVLPRWLLTDRLAFDAWEQRGYHVTPVGFYQPVPELVSLPPEHWRKDRECIGIDFRVNHQIDLLESLRTGFLAEYSRFQEPGCPFNFNQGFFGSVDAEVLYGLVRREKPKRIVEIGSGYSTVLSSMALEKNTAEGAPGELIAIEPYPKREVLDKCKRLTRLVEKKVEEVDLGEFEQLGERDILFIDSSHVSRVASDVNYEFFEILPRLKPGVLIHVHDIFLPGDYPEAWIKEHKLFWNELYLLRAFLSFNDSFEVVWAGAQMNRLHPDLLQAAFPSYRKGATEPGSFWFRRIR